MGDEEVMDTNRKAYVSWEVQAKAYPRDIKLNGIQAESRAKPREDQKAAHAASSSKDEDGQSQTFIGNGRTMGATSSPGIQESSVKNEQLNTIAEDQATVREERKGAHAASSSSADFWASRALWDKPAVSKINKEVRCQSTSTLPVPLH